METSSVNCPKCKGHVIIPVLTAEERADAGKELRQFPGTISQIKRLREIYGFDLADAKRFATHFGEAKGVCAKCMTLLPDHTSSAEYVICRHCRSLNLDW